MHPVLRCVGAFKQKNEVSPCKRKEDEEESSNNEGIRKREDN